MDLLVANPYTISAAADLDSGLVGSLWAVTVTVVDRAKIS